MAGNLFKPTDPLTRKDTIDFRLDLGPQVLAVVPQPTNRVNGQLQQQRDAIVVYFDSDKLLVENDANGRPTNRSVENPEFYRLIFTSDYLVFSMDLKGDTGVGRCVIRGRCVRRSRFRTAGGRLTRDGMNGVREMNSAAG